jgi:anti-sigma factor RsiW
MNNPNKNSRMPSPQERFELLSAYLDNEVSREEKLLVEQWLSTDENFRRLHQQQLRLRQMLIDLPVPKTSPKAAKASTELTIDRVMAEIDRRSQRRKWAWGGIGLAAAAVVAVVGSVFTLNPSPQFSPVSNQFKPAQEEPLILAMEKPIVPIPKSMTDKQPDK